MRLNCIVFVAALAIAQSASVQAVHGGCAFDHFHIGQDSGVLVVDTSAVYRHWNADYGTNPDPYSQQYYEFMDMYPSGYIRIEPAFGETEDPAYALTGQRGVDYNIFVQRMSSVGPLEMFDEYSQPILENDGDTICLSDHENHHIHTRYVTHQDPHQPYSVTFMLFDDMGTYGPSQPFTVRFGAMPEPACAVLLAVGVFHAMVSRRRAR